MSKQGRHFHERLLAAEMLAILLKLFCLADIAQDKHRGGAGGALLQPGVTDGDPDGLGMIRTRWIQIGERQFVLFATPARQAERRRERDGQCLNRFEAATEQAGRFRVQSRNPGSGFDHQNTARQALHNAAQTFADAVIFFETGGQIAVGDFQFLAKMRHLPLQLSVRTLQ
jgi:hypothetical protein